MINIEIYNKLIGILAKPPEIPNKTRNYSDYMLPTDDVRNLRRALLDRRIGTLEPSSLRITDLHDLQNKYPYLYLQSARPIQNDEFQEDPVIMLKGYRFGLVHTFREPNGSIKEREISRFYILNSNGKTWTYEIWVEFGRQNYGRVLREKGNSLSEETWSKVLELTIPQFV